MILLYSLSKLLLHKKRLINFSEINRDLSLYAAEYSINNNFHYPFYRLQSDMIWEVEADSGLVPNASGDVSKASLLGSNARGGFTQGIYQALSDDKFLFQAVVDSIINTYAVDEVFLGYLDELNLLPNKVEDISFSSESYDINSPRKPSDP